MTEQEIRKCIICGKDFEPYQNRKTIITCGDPECQKLRKKQTMCVWNQKHTEKLRMAKKEHARKRYARRVYGARGTSMEELVPKPLPDMEEPSDYSRRQIEKTLASLPKIKTEL